MKNKFPYRYGVMILIFTLILITYLDRVCISLVGVRIKTQFKLSNEQLGWVLGAFALAYALFEIPGGIIGDKIGQRKVLMRIVLWWSLFTALTGLTVGLLSLVIIRFLFGAGEAGAFPNATGVVARWFPANETSKAISTMIVGTSAGSALAPLIVVPLAAAYGWRTPFFVSGSIGLVWVMVCFVWFKNHPAEMKSISAAEKNLIESNRKFSAHASSTSFKNYFKQKNTWFMMLAFFCSQWSLFFFIAWMPVYLQQGRHFTENEMKTTTSLLFLCGIAGALSAGVINDWLARKKGIRFARKLIGMLGLAVMSIIFFTVANTTNNITASVLLIMCYPFMPVYSVTAFSTCVDVGGNNACTVAGIMNFAGSAGAFSLSIFFGKIVDVTNNYNTPLLVIAAVLFAGAVCWVNVNAEKKCITGSVAINQESSLQLPLIVE